MLVATLCFTLQMIGVGTSKARIAYLTDRFVSRLGMDEETWGFSCHGLFHHNGERRCYAQKFDQGNIIGVHLDLWRGTLSFYKNRKHLGMSYLYFHFVSYCLHYLYALSIRKFIHFSSIQLMFFLIQSNTKQYSK